MAYYQRFLEAHTIFKFLFFAWLSELALAVNKYESKVLPKAVWIHNLTFSSIQKLHSKFSLKKLTFCEKTLACIHPYIFKQRSES